MRTVSDVKEEAMAVHLRLLIWTMSVRLAPFGLSLSQPRT